MLFVTIFGVADLANECATAKPSPLGVLGVSLNEQLVQDSNVTQNNTVRSYKLSCYKLSCFEIILNNSID
ncbi:hypothetical protein H1P_190022 [Hyella patelloides LEGE 07179]|uniref:Uncharacterized protein n=1 Tax=Hyella patelloides LEGE 07179 TaxID=945734 RepID=A0A563VP68_9CYAN|nr:hypothetical protein H1P_190022 [Hyella patelloides LEGE 07179]